MDTETREIIERLRALGDGCYLGEIVSVFIGKRNSSSNAKEFRELLIDLLERSDPDEWTDEQLGEYGLVRLPRDKDGEVCHIGDTVWDDYGHEWSVYDVRIECEQVFLEKHGSSVTRGLNSRDVTHRPPVTVESVLTEFVEKWHSTHYDDIPALKAEYAKRLRLAEVDE